MKVPELDEIESAAAAATRKRLHPTVKQKLTVRKKRASSGRGPGAPRKIDTDDPKVLATLKGLGAIQATIRECAAVLGIASRTMDDVLKRSPEAREIYEDGKAEGRASLRRLQFRLAEQGSAAMAIFLGKNLLGQADRQDHTLAAPDGGPVKHEVSALDHLESRISGVAARIGTDGAYQKPVGTTSH